MQEAIDALVAGCGRVAWGVAVTIDGERVAEVSADQRLPSASMGKVLLLIEVASRLVSGTLDPEERLAAGPGECVADSGLWQHLDEPTLAVSSLAVLVGAVSDNTATNVLLRRVGLDAVQRRSEELGIPATGMTDRIRDAREANHPVAPSFARASDLASLMDGLAAGSVVSPDVSGAVVQWLAAGVDLSMTASAFGLDPLAHRDGELRLFHKTGTDRGVRADAGHVTGPRGSAAYAVLAQWRPDADPAREAADVMRVLRVMREIGQHIDSRIR